MKDKYIYTVLKEANKAFKANEVPVGAIIVRNNKIIAKAHNTRQKSHICINHAEIIAISKASRKLKDWRLDDCDLYVSLEPCVMCKEVIKQSRIKNVYYLLDSKFNANPSCKINYEKIISREISDYEMLLSRFFSNKR